MKSPLPLSRELQERILSLAISLAAVLFGAIVPVLPLLRRRAFHVAGLFGLFWLFSLIVFFFLFAGVGFLGHLGLWFLSSLALLMPKRLARIEAFLAHHAATLMATAARIGGAR